MFTNKTLNYKLYTGSFYDSTGNYTLICQTLWPVTKIPLHVKVT